MPAFSSPSARRLPPLPVYAQPPIPGPGYLWTPGYWAWDEDISSDLLLDARRLVPAPKPGLLWTPGYWGSNDGVYVWNDGYWGTGSRVLWRRELRIGYTGVGFHGGHWGPGELLQPVRHQRQQHHGHNQRLQSDRHHQQRQQSLRQRRPQRHKSDADAYRNCWPRTSRIRPRRRISSIIGSSLADKELHASVNKGKPPIAAVSKAGDFKHPFAAQGRTGVRSKPASLTGSHPRCPSRRSRPPRQAERPGRRKADERRSPAAGRRPWQERHRSWRE